MKRRHLMALAAVAALAPKTLLAQKKFRIATLDDAVEGIRAAAWATFRRRLGELGLGDVAYESRYARGEPKKLPALAQELARRKPDVFVTAGTSATVAAMKTTTSIPIVFAGAGAGDPVGTGLVASLARPGGNVTGTSLPGLEILDKSFESLRELTPGAKSYAYLTDASNKASGLSFPHLQEKARKLKVSILMLDAREASVLEKSFAAIRRERVQGLLVGLAAVMLEHRGHIVQFAARERLPAVYSRREYVDAGGLMSCGGDVQALYLRTAEYVRRVLGGARPADLPVEQVSGTRIVLNMKAAHAAGITVPRALRTRADEVIE